MAKKGGGVCLVIAVGKPKRARRGGTSMPIRKTVARKKKRQGG